MTEEIIKKNLSILEEVFNELNDKIEKLQRSIEINSIPDVDVEARDELNKQRSKIERALVSIETSYSDFEKLKYSKHFKSTLNDPAYNNSLGFKYIVQDLGAFIGELDAKLALGILKKETKKRLPFVYYP